MYAAAKHKIILSWPFDVFALFNMLPLDYTIHLTLNWNYGDKEIESKISKKDIKNLLLLCTKDGHLTFRNNIYQKKEGVAMGSPLGPVVAGVSTVHLERTKNTHAKTIEIYDSFEKISRWYHRLHIKLDFIMSTINILNKLYENMKFTYEVKHVKIWSIGKLEVTNFRKETNTNKYLHWRSFALITWKKVH